MKIFVFEIRSTFRSSFFSDLHNETVTAGCLLRVYREIQKRLDLAVAGSMRHKAIDLVN